MTDRNFTTKYTDKTIRCVDCGRDFVFTAGEQSFFASKSPPLTEPKRCKACRDYRRMMIHPPTDIDTTLARARKEIERYGNH